MIKHVAGRLARRLAPRTFARLEAVDRLHDELAARSAQLDELAVRCARLEERADAAEDRLRGTGSEICELRGRTDEIGELRDRLGGLGDELAESRRLSLRVAQLTDLVFDRLATTPPAPGRAVSGAREAG